MDQYELNLYPYDVLEYHALFNHLDHFSKSSKKHFEIEIISVSRDKATLHCGAVLTLHTELTDSIIYPFTINYMGKRVVPYCTQPHIDKKNAEGIISSLARAYPEKKRDIINHGFVYKNKSDLEPIIVKVRSVEWKNGKNSLGNTSIIEKHNIVNGDTL